jgi:ABC-type bacteriocin/lantibiotic exporter with double-glycine peptidase domain
VPRGIAELRKMTGGANRATSMLDLKNAAVALGFRVSARRTSFDYLRRHLSQPGSYAILHCDSEHFVAALGADEQFVRVVDPAIGIDDVNEQNLLSSRYRWDGVVLLISSQTEESRASSK